MLSIRDNRPMRLCQRVTRCDFLRVGSLGLGGLTLSSLLTARAQARDRAFVRDKSVVLLFDPGETRLVPGLPVELARTITASEPIRELMT